MLSWLLFLVIGDVGAVLVVEMTKGTGPNPWDAEDPMT